MFIFITSFCHQQCKLIPPTRIFKVPRGPWFGVFQSFTNNLPTPFCYVCVASGVCIVIVVNFVQFEKTKKRKQTKKRVDRLLS